MYLDMESSRLLRRVYKVTGKQTSTSNRNLMTLWYMESQKPTGDERSLVIGTSEADYVVFHCDIKTNHCLPNNQSFRANKVGWRPPEIGQTCTEKTNSI